MKSQTVVIVEDELIIAMDLKRILLQEGYNVIISFKNYNLLDSIYEIEKHQPDLVILDINLNQLEFDGITIAHHLLIKDFFPFIFITGFSDKEILERIRDKFKEGENKHNVILKSKLTNEINNR